MKFDPGLSVAIVVGILGLALFSVGVLVLVKNFRRIITTSREAWERGQLRTPDGQFKFPPTLNEARRFAGARGEPLHTAPPVVLPPGAVDAIDESAALFHGSIPAPVIPPPARSGWRFRRSDPSATKLPD